MCDDHSKKISRRSLLAGAGAGLALLKMSPLEILADSIVRGIIGEAHAQSSGASNLINYVHLSMNGGVPRWYFDLPLAPNGDDAFAQNPMLITSATRNGNNWTNQYKMFRVGDYYLPHLWSTIVPRVGGGSLALSALAQNMLIFRGVNLLADGHNQNREKQVTPVPGQPSISGLAADKHIAMIPAVRLGSGLGFRSESGSGAVDVNSSNPISKLLEPFDLNDPIGFGNKDHVEFTIDRALASLQQVAQNSDHKTKSFFSDHKNAKKLFLTNFGNLSTVYTDLANKYELLIRRALTEHTLSGVDQMPLYSDAGSMCSLESGGRRIIKSGTDLRDTIVRDGVTAGDASLSVSHANTTVSNLAKSMALSEFILTNNLSCSTTLNISHLTNLRLPLENGTLMTGISNNDAHETGAICGMFYFTKYYKAIATCMLELVNVLKANNLYDRTVIHLSSEFNRSARSNGTGSDHGWRGSNATVFSGMIQGTQVIGDIESDYRGDSNRRGAWGVAAEMSDLSGREMLIGNVASSIASMLEVKSPTPNDATFINKSNGKANIYASKPKNHAA